MLPIDSLSSIVERLVSDRVTATAGDEAGIKALNPSLQALAAARAASQRSAAQLAASRGTSSASSDVRIHIGRIEVVAVPQAAARPVAARAAPRAMGLDEYLRRRDRGFG